MIGNAEYIAKYEQVQQENSSISSETSSVQPEPTPQPEPQPEPGFFDKIFGSIGCGSSLFSGNAMGLLILFLGVLVFVKKAVADKK